MSFSRTFRSVVRTNSSYVKENNNNMFRRIFQNNTKGKELIRIEEEVDTEREA